MERDENKHKLNKKNMKNKNIRFLQFFTDTLIFLTSFFLIKYNFKSTSFTDIVLPVCLVTIIVILPLFIFNRIIISSYFSKILKIYYRGTFLFMVIAPLVGMFLIINNKTSGIITSFHNNEVWNILLSYYYQLIIICCLLFNVLIAPFLTKENDNTLSEKKMYRKLYIIYLFVLLLLPLFISKVAPHSIIIKI